MDKKLEKLMNEQITKEFFSAYLYLAMAAYFDAEGLEGFSHWMRVQAQEEILHGMKIFDFLGDRGAKIALGPISKPENDFSSIEEVFKKTLEHERKVTASINSLCSAAKEANDNSTGIFLQWFVNEQVEEEKNSADILNKLKYVKGQPAGILVLDKELAMRPQPALASGEGNSKG